MRKTTLQTQIRKGEKLMAKNKLDPVNFCRIMDMFGEEAARDTLQDVNEGKIREELLERYLYEDESKEEYAERLKRE